MELKPASLPTCIRRCNVLIVPFMELKRIDDMRSIELTGSLNRTFYGIETL